MFKRKDWNLLHKRDGDDSSDSETSDGESDSDAESIDSGSDEEPSTTNLQQMPSDSEDDSLRQHGDGDLEDDDDDDEGDDDDMYGEDIVGSSDDDRVPVEDVVQNWMDAARKDVIKGVSLKCSLCKGVILLNPTSLRQHLASKPHKKRMEKWSDTSRLPLAYSRDVNEEEQDVETHAERLERIEQQLQAVRQKQQKSGEKQALNGRARRKRKQRVKAAKKAAASEANGNAKRPGKRQRAALKAARLGDAGDDGAGKGDAGDDGARLGDARDDRARKGDATKETALKAGNVSSGVVGKLSRSSKQRREGKAAGGEKGVKANGKRVGNGQEQGVNVAVKSANGGKRGKLREKKRAKQQ